MRRRQGMKLRNIFSRKAFNALKQAVNAKKAQVKYAEYKK